MGFAVVIGQWLGAGNRPAEGGVFQPVPVKLEKIAKEDQWLFDFDIIFCPVQWVRSDSVYGVLVLTPKHGQMLHLDAGRREFVLSGYAVEDEMPVFIDKDYFSQHPGAPEIVLLDFFQGPKFDQIDKSKVLVLRSSHD